MERGNMRAEAQPNLITAMPFVLLLTAIALAPLYFANWWSRHFGKVTLLLAGLTLGYYMLVLGAQERALHTAADYVSFICLIGALFVISGGIHINVKGEATPRLNVLFLLIGALVANLLGTTGASMLLIRPWLRMNKYRLTGHHIVFFIFLISNVGGSLTPVGDPPLFLGYLKGVPFWWMIEQCWAIWLIGVGVLLAIFFVVDTLNFRRAPKVVRERETAHEQWRFEGLGNVVFLAIVLGAVFIEHPLFLREAIMIGAAAGSYFSTRKRIHEANHFNFGPIREVAILFAGIFATMMPALDWLRSHSGGLGSATPTLFYWGSGALSSVLDNAPTYLSFLSTAYGTSAPTDSIAGIVAYVNAHGAEFSGLAGGPHAEIICRAISGLQRYFPKELLAGKVNSDHVQMALMLMSPSEVKFLQAISIGSVFFGANTYIGNGPNFMVKAIADQQKVHTPTFPGYVFKFTLPIMIPMLLIVWWFFFRA